jgi:hypothetical protein
MKMWLFRTIEGNIFTRLSGIKKGIKYISGAKE